MIFDSTCGGHVAKLSSIDKYFGIDNNLSGIGISQRNGPAGRRLFCTFKRVSVPQHETRFGSGHLVENLVADVRLEEDIADPAAFKSLIATIVCSQAIAEFTKDSGTHVIVSIHSTYTGCCEHTSKPRTFFRYHHRDSAAGSLYTGSRTAGTAAHYEHIRIFDLFRINISESVCNANFASLNSLSHRRSEHVLGKRSVYPRSLER